MDARWYNYLCLNTLRPKNVEEFCRVTSFGQSPLARTPQSPVLLADLENPGNILRPDMLKTKGWGTFFRHLSSIDFMHFRLLRKSAKAKYLVHHEVSCTNPAMLRAAVGQRCFTFFAHFHKVTQRFLGQKEWHQSFSGIVKATTPRLSMRKVACVVWVPFEFHLHCNSNLWHYCISSGVLSSEATKLVVSLNFSH